MTLLCFLQSTQNLTKSLISPRAHNTSVSYSTYISTYKQFLKGFENEHDLSKVNFLKL